MPNGSFSFKLELDAIKALRHHFPSAGQRTLATRIKQMDFKFDEAKSLAARLSNRPWASIYGAIRRLDKAIKSNTPALATASA